MTTSSIEDRIYNTITDVSIGIDKLKAERDELENRLTVAALMIDEVVTELKKLRDLPTTAVNMYVEENIQELIIQLTALREEVLKP